MLTAALLQAEQAKLVATQQRLQECEAGMLDLTGHLQKAHSDAADDLKVRCALQLPGLCHLCHLPRHQPCVKAKMI